MIRLTDVQKEYENGTHALRGVTMEVNDGEFVFLVGPSGSGKSTIIKLLTGEVLPSGGRLMINGFNLNNISDRQIPLLRRSIGVIFQDFRLIANKTVYDNLALAMRAVGAQPKELRSRIPYVLALVGLADKGSRYPDELSGGEQQRVAIARALALDPDILCFDEPTSALDPELTQEVLSVIRDLAAEGHTMIVVTHEMSFAREVAGRILYMAEGEILCEGTPAQVFADARVRAFAGDDA